MSQQTAQGVTRHAPLVANVRTLSPGVSPGGRPRGLVAGRTGPPGSSAVAVAGRARSGGGRGRVAGLAEAHPVSRASCRGTSPPWARWPRSLVALTGPRPAGGGPDAVLVLDRSASIDSAIDASELRWVGHAQRGRVVTYAAGAQTLPAQAAAIERSSPCGGSRGQRSVRGSGGGDRGRGAERPGCRGRRRRTDGRRCAGSYGRRTAQARRRRRRGAAVAPCRRLGDQDLRALRRPPGRHRLADRHRARVGARARPADRPPRRGDPDSQVVQLRDGETPITLAYTATGQGWHSFDVSVHLKDDQVPQNNSLSTVVRVGPPPRVLVAASGASALAPLLAARGLRVASTTRSQLPAAAAATAGSTRSCSRRQRRRALGRAGRGARRRVRIGGLGVTAIGGPASYSLGGYAQSGIQRMLPLSSLVPGDLQRRNLALELVIDRSGSMADLSNGVPKIQMAQRAMRADAGRSSRSTGTSWGSSTSTSPRTRSSAAPGRAGRPRAVAGRIDGLRADGGTDIFLGLEHGLEQILAQRLAEPAHDPDDRRHQPAAQLHAAARASPAAHHRRTVALGTDLDVPLLKATPGRRAATPTRRQRPRSCRGSSRRRRAERQAGAGHGRPAVARRPARRSCVRWPANQLPGLTGNVVTTAKPGAQADLVAAPAPDRPIPALAEWQYGIGRVVAWTPGLGPPWAADGAARPRSGTTPSAGQPVRRRLPRLDSR